MSECEKFSIAGLVTLIYFLVYPNHHSHCNKLRCYTACSISSYYCSFFFYWSSWFWSFHSIPYAAIQEIFLILYCLSYYYVLVASITYDTNIKILSRTFKGCQYHTPGDFFHPVSSQLHPHCHALAATLTTTDTIQPHTPAVLRNLVLSGNLMFLAS